MNSLPLPDAALSYAERGFPVFPVLESGRAPAIAKNRGGKGFNDATTDLATVNAWWKKNPRYNIGIACKPPFLPFDIDPDIDHPRACGDVSFENICAEIGKEHFD